MKFLKLKLNTNKLEDQYQFFSKTLGFEILEKTINSFTVNVGWSELSFVESKKEFYYHYCFLLPSNKLIEALEFMEKRINIINIENGRKIKKFESWNAESFYFYDASGNLAEFIFRNDLKIFDENDFNISKIVGINEIGMPTKNIKKLNNQLKSELKTEFWKGDLERFGTNGSQEGLFLLPNYEVKEIWFPTTLKIKPFEFQAIVQNNDKIFQLIFKNEELKISEILA